MNIQGKEMKVMGIKNNKDITIVSRKRDVYIFYDDNSINFACQDSTWIIDSSVSCHLNLRRDFFSSYIVGAFWNNKKK